MDHGSGSTCAAPRGLVTVFAHVHYPEIWQEMAVLIAERLTRPFRLVITTTAADVRLAIPETPFLRGCDLVEVENRGRDILPFLAALSRSDEVGIGLKIHTKRSPQRADGDLWRERALQALLPADGGVLSILDRLEGDARIGMAPPGGFTLSVAPWIGINRVALDRLMAVLTLGEADLADCFFAAGSMFWFRRDAIADLTSTAVLELFEAEEGQLDATTAHAMERLFPVVARRSGYLSLATPALLASRPAMSRAELLGLARDYADLPSTFFPAPNVPALPPTAEGMREALAIHRAARGFHLDLSAQTAPSLQRRVRGLVGRLLRRR